MSQKLIYSSQGSIGSVKSDEYGGVTSNQVRELKVDTIEGAKDGEEGTPAKKY